MGSKKNGYKGKIKIFVGEPPEKSVMQQMIENGSICIQTHLRPAAEFLIQAGAKTIKEQTGMKPVRVNFLSQGTAPRDMHEAGIILTAAFNLGYEPIQQAVMLAKSKPSAPAQSQP